MRDVDGNVDKLRVDLTQPRLLEALNTTAGRRRRRPGQERGRHEPSRPVAAGYLRRCASWCAGRWSGSAHRGPGAISRAWGSDCTEAPTPDVPGVRDRRRSSTRRLSRSRRRQDPFATGSSDHDLRAVRLRRPALAHLRPRLRPGRGAHPDAVIGTALSNWIMQRCRLAVAALTALESPRWRFNPTFLDRLRPGDRADLHRPARQPVRILDPGGHRRYSACASCFKARRSSLATTAAADRLGADGDPDHDRALPVACSRRDTSPTTPSPAPSASVVPSSTAAEREVDPAVAVASNVQESIFYQVLARRHLGHRPTARPRRSTAGSCSRRRR